MPALEDVCVAIVDCEHKTAPKADAGYPLVRTTDIGRGRLDLSEVQRVDAVTYAEWTRRAVPQPGDLILAREAPVGNVALVTPGLEPVLGQRTVLIRPDPELVDPDYLNYRLLAHDIQHWMNGVANGATVPHLNVEDIRGLPLPTLPSLEKQKAIGAALAAFDDLAENNRARIEVLEESFRLNYRECSREGSTAKFGDLVDVVRDADDPPRIPTGAVLVGLEHLPRRSITLVEWDHAHAVGSRKSRFAAGDVLFGKIRPYFHKVVSAPVDGWCSTDAIVFRPRAGYETLSLAVASSDGFVAHAVQTSNGTKMPRANTDVLLDYPVTLPRKAALSRFEELGTAIVALCKTLSRQRSVLLRTRDVLLPQLVFGNLDIPVPDDVVAKPSL